MEEQQRIKRQSWEEARVRQRVEVGPNVKGSPGECRNK